MALRKRGKNWEVLVRLYGEQVSVTTRTGLKTVAQKIEQSIILACESGDWNFMDPRSRATLVRIYRNRKWALPDEVKASEQAAKPKQEVTLWAAAELFLRSPDVVSCQERSRYENSIAHLVRYFGKKAVMNEIWIPEIRAYMADRVSKGAAAATVNREKGTLSKMFQNLVEHRIVEANPARLIPNLSQKAGERQVYLSFQGVELIASACPQWFQGLIWASYYSGMRRGEILSLKRQQVDFCKRIITLTPENTKEFHWKRIPIHRNFVPVIEDAMRVPYLASDRVFLLQDKKGMRPIGVEATKNPWDRACRSLGLEKPWPRFHDLRHTWRSNARRSGVPDQLAEMILGHALRGKRVDERYGYISDDELVAAIDQFTYDHGETKILVARS